MDINEKLRESRRKRAELNDVIRSLKSENERLSTENNKLEVDNQKLERSFAIVFVCLAFSVIILIFSF